MEYFVYSVVAEKKAIEFTCRNVMFYDRLKLPKA